MMYAIQVKCLSKRIGENTILNEISMQVKDGEIYGFLGANGAGHERIGEMLSLFDLAGAENKPVKNFSLGMKQRLALARAILTRPKLLILDEPMNGLDPQGINAMRELLLKINQEDRTTILISSHILSELEKIADTIGVIDKGRLLAEVSVNELRDKDISLETYYLDLLKEVN